MDEKLTRRRLKQFAWLRQAINMILPNSGFSNMSHLDLPELTISIGLMSPCQMEQNPNGAGKIIGSVFPAPHPRHSWETQASIPGSVAPRNAIVAMP